MNLRHISTLIIFFSIIFLPFWVYIPLGLAAMFIFPLYWEGLFLGFLIDCLYGRGVGSIFTLFSPVAFASLVILASLVPVRERIRVHA